MHEVEKELRGDLAKEDALVARVRRENEGLNAENQRLRENLLFFTTQHKPATAPEASRRRGVEASMSLTMPLPPV